MRNAVPFLVTAVNCIQLVVCREAIGKAVKKVKPCAAWLRGAVQEAF